MSKIDDILEEQGFTAQEAASFMKIVKQAKSEQETGLKVNLKKFIANELEELVKYESPKYKL